MAHPVYYVEENDTLPIFFDTFDGGTGASITMTGLAVTDIEIFKDGGITQRASDAGYTLLDTDGIDFDGITGIHGFSIDLSDNTDAGFFAVGPWYHVVVSAITVDAQTVNFVAAAFRIVSATRGLAGTALPAAAADAAGGLLISDAGGLDIDAKLANTNEVTVARMGALTDWIDGGRLDLIVDAILDDTDLIDDATSGLAKIATDVAAVLVDTGTDGVVVNAAGLATDAVNEIRNAITGGAYALDTDANGRTRIVDGIGAGELDTLSGTVLLRAATQASIDAIEADTNELQADWTNGGRLDLIIDAVLADTGELQSDDVPGLIAALNDVSVSDILTTSMTESYAANGAAFTLAQGLYAIHQKLMQGKYSGTTSTVFKLDNVTTAFTGTLDDNTNPTEDRREAA